MSRISDADFHGVYCSCDECTARDVLDKIEGKKTAQERFEEAERSRMALLSMYHQAACQDRQANMAQQKAAYSASNQLQTQRWSRGSIGNCADNRASQSALGVIASNLFGKLWS